MKAQRIVATIVIAALAICLSQGPAKAQQRFGNETVFEHTPSVEELNALFKTAGKPGGKSPGLPKGTRSIVLTAPAAPQSAPTGGAATVTQAPPSTGGATQSKTVSLRIQFDLNSAEIKPQYEPALANLAAYMVENPDVAMEIGGHADSIGDAGHNLDLSNRRAQSVREFLIGVHGIAATRLTARGFGETLPLSGLAGNDGRNRRVSFTAFGS